MDSAELARQLKPAFDRDGYVLIRGFYSPSEAQALRERFDRMIAQEVPSWPATEALYEVKGRPETLKYLSRVAEHDPYFKELIASDRFVKLAEGLLGDGVVSHGLEWFNKCPVLGKATPPHQDGYYYMLDPNEAIHFWLALDPVDEGNGCVRYVRGSHRQGVRPHTRGNTIGFSLGMSDFGPADLALEQPTTLAPGDLLAHHSLSIHRADANTSERNRRAMGLVYFAARAKVDHQRRDEYNRKLMAELAQQGKI